MTSLINDEEKIMYKFDREKFFDGYRDKFGPLRQPLVEALEDLLNQIEKDDRFEGTIEPRTGRRQLAYCLATFKWETAHTMRPIDEFGSEERFNRLYGPQTSVGKRLGNTEPGDGARFHGRGYVQLTGRNNYERAGRFTGVDLIADPAKAKDPALAYRIAIQGMKEGWFTSKKLSQFFKDGAMPDFTGARRIINGQDKAQEIAMLARRIDEILVFSLQQ